MRVLGIGHHNDLGDLYMRLMARGHDVRVHIADPESRDILDGLVARSADWQVDLDWVRGDPSGLVIFEETGWGLEQDRLRREGLRVIGGSALGDRLENDRVFGQAALRDAGLGTAPSFEFDGFDAAIAHLEEAPGRYVLKFSGEDFASTRSYVGALDDGEDVLAVLRLQRAKWTYEERPRVILMKHLAGIEVGVGSFFNGAEFLRPANLDWEHKRFFPGNIGELTGEMGTVVTYRGAERLFEATLARLTPLLRGAGYVGYINLNMIVNDDGPWPLELTCRFGYPGFAILSALHAEPWDVILDRVASGLETTLATHEGVAVGIVLTVPPFPYPDGYERLSKGMPICFRRDLDAADRAALHYGEVRIDAGQLVTAGQIGYVMVVTGSGPTIDEARARAYARVEKVVIPNVRYRIDIGATYDSHERAELVRMGWLGARDE
jgi:phosphoribosylamine---glycine ligase